MTNIQNKIILRLAGILLIVILVSAICGFTVNAAFHDTWNKIFIVTPLLEDQRNLWDWVCVEDNTLFEGEGFDRMDVCNFECDCSTDCDYFSGCNSFRGGGTDECLGLGCDNQCCTTDSGSDCPGGLGDCYGGPCKVKAEIGLFYDLVGGSCPPGFTKKRVDVYVRQWGTVGPTKPYKCVVEGGVEVTTVIEILGPTTEKSVKTPYIYIANSNQGTVTKLDIADGRYVCKYSVGSSPSRTSVDLNGDVWVGNRNSNTVTKLKGEGDTCTVIGTYSVGSGPRAVAADVDDNVWVGDYTHGGLWLLDTDGRCIHGNKGGCTKPGISVGGNPYGAVVDGMGHVFIANRGSCGINKIDASGTVVASKGLNCPYGISIDSDRNVWVASYTGSGPTIYKLKNSDMSTLCSGTVPGGYTQAGGRGVSVDLDNNVWVADSKNNVVHKFDNDCNHLLTVSVGSGPVGVAADQNNNIWVVNRGGGGPSCTCNTPACVTPYCGGGSVTKLTNDGTLIATYPVSGNPYTYSDMSGSGLLKVSTKSYAGKGVGADVKTEDSATQPFSVVSKDVKMSKGKITIKRIYKPSNPDLEFIVNTKVTPDFSIYDSADHVTFYVNTTYKTIVKRDLYYSACSYHKCYSSCSCGGSKQYKLHYGYVGCGGTSDIHSYSCKCKKKKGKCKSCKTIDTIINRRTEIKTIFTEYVETEADTFTTDKVSHEDILNNTQISVNGTIDQFLDDEGNVGILGTIHITLDPDILRMFTFQVNESSISYFPVMHPVKHYLYKKFASPGEINKKYNHSDSYGYERSEFEFNEVCTRECPPSPICWCPPDNRFDVTCVNDTGEKFNPNTDSDPDNDCVCSQNDCYPNPCKSERSFHEEQGIRVRNGEFERDFGSEWNNWKDTGAVSRVSGGFSGYCAKLGSGGSIRQGIAPIPLHTLPHNELCFMYGVEKCENDGSFNVSLNGDFADFVILCNNHVQPYCDLPLSWNKKCITVDKYISSIEFKSRNMVVYVDNVNLGSYYDFVGLQTENVSNMDKYYGVGFAEYSSNGLLVSSGNIKQNQTGHKSTYSFDFETITLPYIDVDTSEAGQYGLVENDFWERSNITIFTHFRNITLNLFPAHCSNPCVHILLKNPSRIDYKLDTKPYLIESGQEVHGDLKVYYYDADTRHPLGGEKIYITGEGGKVEFLSPSSLITDGYVTTDVNGEAGFSFSVGDTAILYFSFEGNEYVSPTSTDVQVGSTEFRSPFFKGDFLASFLILILILIFILLSYKFFKEKGMNVGEWLKELGGEE